jgi:hypothetical protein
LPIRGRYRQIKKISFSHGLGQTQICSDNCCISGLPRKAASFCQLERPKASFVAEKIRRRRYEFRIHPA